MNPYVTDMINRIYVSDKEIKTLEDTYPRKQFEKGYDIVCNNCNERITRKWLDRKIFKEVYTCKSCVLINNNPMHTPEGRAAYEEKRYSEEYLQANRDRDQSGENNPFYGKSHTKETIEHLRQSSKEQWAAKSTEEREQWSKECSKYQQKIKERDPEAYSAMKRRAGIESHKAQFVNAEMNKPESIVSDYLQQIHCGFEFSVVLNKYQYDFGLKEYKILIEVDGDYWHGHPDMYNEDGSDGKRKLNNIQRGKIKRDAEKIKWAIDNGFKLYRVWEMDIYNGNYKNILNKIKHEVS